MKTDKQINAICAACPAKNLCPFIVIAPVSRELYCPVALDFHSSAGQAFMEMYVMQEEASTELVDQLKKSYWQGGSIQKPGVYEMYLFSEQDFKYLQNFN